MATYAAVHAAMKRFYSAASKLATRFGADELTDEHKAAYGLDDRLVDGETPDDTALHLEGCAELTPGQLLESWALHALHHLSRLEDQGGRAALHRDWRGLAWNMGEEIEVAQGGETLTGTFLGVDENFGLLLRVGEGDTRLVPLSSRLIR